MKTLFVSAFTVMCLVFASCASDSDDKNYLEENYFSV